LNVTQLDSILNFLASVAERAELASPWSPLLSDPDDEAFVKLAAAGRADFIVTHNLRHFEAATHSGFKVLAPRQFLATIKG
jgi:predicted nucleic acid-binding protein